MDRRQFLKTIGGGSAVAGSAGLWFFGVQAGRDPEFRGISVRVKSGNIEKAPEVGECGWGGAAGTHFWISPADGLAVVTLEQIQPYSTQTKAAVKGIIHDAIEK